MRLDIKCNRRWVCNFHKRHGIVSRARNSGESSDSETKNINKDQVMPEQSIKVENLPSPSASPPIGSTYSKILEGSIKFENFCSESCSSPTDVYCNYIWEEYDIKSEGDSPSPEDDRSSDDK
ncbi:PREDICTED: uncharacterized protein LOC105563007 [Vollenhovia emeryi]|uniref:uncharacterized protein LOC105563007 n=1 Tax=Vollenhovia emeryi TaxID=411798 RepID=UPI0005F500BF|nr:PREDICTED: uncharacterized protein LOC105563007 [Vollenhovia emeryi]